MPVDIALFAEDGESEEEVERVHLLDPRQHRVRKLVLLPVAINSQNAGIGNLDMPWMTPCAAITKMLCLRCAAITKVLRLDRLQ